MPESNYESKSSESGEFRWSEPSPDPDDRRPWMLTIAIDGKPITKFISPEGRYEVAWDSMIECKGRLTVTLEPCE